MYTGTYFLAYYGISLRTSYIHTGTYRHDGKKKKHWSKKKRNKKIDGNAAHFGREKIEQPQRLL